MMMHHEPQIHPTAIIASGVKIGRNVQIGPYVVIPSPHVIIEDDVVIHSHVYIDGFTTIGSGTLINQNVCIGTKGQIFKSSAKNAFVKIGTHCVIGAYVTIQSPTKEDTIVKIGQDSIIMPYSHIAHDCEIGNRVFLSHAVALAGHVKIEDDVTIGKMTGVHQFVRIGCKVKVTMMSGIPKDIPPFALVKGIPAKYVALNMDGLNKGSDHPNLFDELQKAFEILFFSKLHIQEALAMIRKECSPLAEIDRLIDFCLHSKRGIISIL